MEIKNGQLASHWRSYEEVLATRVLLLQRLTTTQADDLFQNEDMGGCLMICEAILVTPNVSSYILFKIHLLRARVFTYPETTSVPYCLVADPGGEACHACCGALACLLTLTDRHDFSDLWYEWQCVLESEVIKASYRRDGLKLYDDLGGLTQSEIQFVLDNHGRATSATDPNEIETGTHKATLKEIEEQAKILEDTGVENAQLKDQTAPLTLPRNNGGKAESFRQS